MLLLPKFRSLQAEAGSLLLDECLLGPRRGLEYCLSNKQDRIVHGGTSLVGWPVCLSSCGLGSRFGGLVQGC